MCVFWSYFTVIVIVSMRRITLISVLKAICKSDFYFCFFVFFFLGGKLTIFLSRDNDTLRKIVLDASISDDNNDDDTTNIIREIESLSAKHANDPKSITKVKKNDMSMCVIMS